MAKSQDTIHSSAGAMNKTPPVLSAIHHIKIAFLKKYFDSTKSIVHLFTKIFVDQLALLKNAYEQY